MPANPYDRVEQGLEQLLTRLLPSEYLKEVMAEVFQGTFSFWVVSCKDLVVQQVVGLILDGAKPDDLEGLTFHEALTLIHPNDSQKVDEWDQKLKMVIDTGIPYENTEQFGDIKIETKTMRVGENGHSMIIVSSKRVD